MTDFKCVGYILDESGTNGAECCRKMANERKFAGTIRSLVNGTVEVCNLSMQGGFMKHYSWLFYYMVVKQWDVGIRGVYIDNLGGLLG